MTSSETDFFISYCGVDEPWAAWIAWQLEAEGFSVVVQTWDFQPGRDFLHEMEAALARSHRVVCLLSPGYVKSPYCEAEWRATYAADPSGERGLLVPVVIEATEEIPHLLATRIHIDLTTEGSSADAASKLLAGLRGGSARPVAEPPFPPSVPAEPPFPGRSSTRVEDWPHRGAASFPYGRLLISLAEGSSQLAVRIDEFDTVGSLLDEIYLKSLVETHMPFTYGSKWHTSAEDRLILPLDALERTGVPQGELAEWRAQTPSEMGLHPDGRLYLRRSGVDTTKLVGVVADNRDTIELMGWWRKVFVKYLKSPTTPTLDVDQAKEVEAFYGVYWSVPSSPHTGRVLDLRGAASQYTLDFRASFEKWRARMDSELKRSRRRARRSTPAA